MLLLGVELQLFFLIKGKNAIFKNADSVSYKIKIRFENARLLQQKLTLIVVISDIHHKQRHHYIVHDPVSTQC